MEARHHPFAALSLILVLPTQLAVLAQTFQELHSFTGPPDGSLPEGALIQARDGNFYGTTLYGGAFTSNGGQPWGLGTVFRMAPDGAVTILASFNGTNGMYPRGALLQGSDGNFYGATINGGPDYPYDSNGTIFRFTPEGGITNLATLSGASGSWPLGDLIEGADGKLYGVASEGGSGGYGTLFRMPRASVRLVEPLFSFNWPDHAAYGLNPSGGLLLANDGNFYGVTASGGPEVYGTVFRMTPGGNLTTMASLNNATGAANPVGGLLKASDGNFYGAAGGGPHGSIYKMTPDGVLTTFAQFDNYTGDTPVGGLIEGRDGKLYGTTYEYYGAVFELTLDGRLRAVVAFTGYGGNYPGAYPYAGLTLGSDGNLYGTCAFQGTGGGGNIFRILMPGPLLTATRSLRHIVLSWRTNYTGFTLQSSTNLASANWMMCSNSPVVSGGQFVVTNLISGTRQFFRLKK
jgi:uncharacterized repeat protein (TIGR03803 family)